jgi:hypothetical protein
VGTPADGVAGASSVEPSGTSDGGSGVGAGFDADPPGDSVGGSTVVPSGDGVTGVVVSGRVDVGVVGGAGQGITGRSGAGYNDGVVVGTWVIVGVGFDERVRSYSVEYSSDVFGTLPVLVVVAAAAPVSTAGCSTIAASATLETADPAGETVDSSLGVRF